MPRVRIPIRYNLSPITIRAWMEKWGKKSGVNWGVDWREVDYRGNEIIIPFNGGNVDELNKVIKEDMCSFDNTIAEFEFVSD
ncbi:hypothetical protein [Photorhabdus cinerea]|uniref:Uncharacterized protein n=1 Tax=Photorhabdus cinerea TaxID=471575 RepID=A0A7X5TGR2_9GAMM|nr:hypothetical protein [Photorhabdus cinerea]NHB91127.1 hypothetical protein [Photorhabdus cinerea]